MVVAEPPLPLLQVVLQVGVTPGDLDDPLDRLPAERRPAEVRVEDDPRGVDHPAEPVGTIALDDLRGPVRRLLRRRQAELLPPSRIGEDPAAELLHDRPARLLHDLPRKPGEALPLLEPEHHLVDLRQILQQFLRVRPCRIHLYPFIFSENRFLLFEPTAYTRGSRSHYKSGSSG